MELLGLSLMIGSIIMIGAIVYIKSVQELETLLGTTETVMLLLLLSFVGLIIMSL